MIFNIRAFNGVSINPEERMESFENGFIETQEKIKKHCDGLGVDPAGYLERHKKLAQAYLSAMSRCMSILVTGRGNFPVESQEKRNDSANKHLTALIDFEENIVKKIEKSVAPKIKLNDKLAKWKEEIFEKEKLQEKMKAANALIRKKDLKGAEALLGGPLEENHLGKRGFMPFELTNNLASIKRLKEQVSQYERLQTSSISGFSFELGRAEYDSDEVRWNIFFNEKPVAGFRSILKSNGFKWSPTRNAWTRGAKTMSISCLKSLLCADIENEARFYL